jgi:signal transduction histidine kinase
MQAARPRTTARFLSVLRWQGFAWLVLLATLGATVGLSQYSRRELARSSSERFTYLAERQRAVLIDRVHDYERVLKGGAGLFAASGTVTRGEWRRYVERLDLQQGLPGIQGIGFAQLIPANEKDAHEAAIRAQGFPDYQVHPAGDRETYSSIVYLEPFAGRNMRAFGFDMSSEPVRHEAMDRARDTGAPAISGRVTLVQETDVDVQPGFLMYVPIYRNDMPTQTRDQRRAAIQGFAFSPFRSLDLMESLYRDPRRDAEIEIHDGERIPSNLLYASRLSERKAQNVVDQEVEVGGHRWQVRFKSTEEFEKRVNSSQPDMILFGGLVASVLLLGAILNDGRHNRRLEQQVRERTRELERARDEAESASRAKSAFLATVSHELRTPLNAIIGFSSILLDESLGGLPAEQRKQVQIINESGRHLLDLIKDILDISSIEAGQLVIHLEAVELHKIVAEQTASMQTLAAERGLELRLEPPTEDVDVLADAIRLRQVLRNLLSNAIKFTDHGSVTVRSWADGDMMRIEVHDTGIGIPQGERDSLFNNFERIGDRKGRLRPGTGLGLAISRRLVEAMDGAIGCESEEGKGSLFWFSLPIARRSAITVPNEQRKRGYATIGGRQAR